MADEVQSEEESSGKAGKQARYVDLSLQAGRKRSKALVPRVAKKHCLCLKLMYKSLLSRSDFRILNPGLSLSPNHLNTSSKHLSLEDISLYLIHQFSMSYNESHRSSPNLFETPTNGDISGAILPPICKSRRCENILSIRSHPILRGKSNAIYKTKNPTCQDY